MCTTSGQWDNMINCVEISNIFVAISTLVVKVFQHAQPLILGQIKRCSRLSGTTVGVRELDIVLIPSGAFGTKFVVVLQQWIKDSTPFARAVVFGSWFNGASSLKHAFVASVTHASDKSTVARGDALANGARAKLGLNRRWLESTLSALGFSVTVVAQLFLVVFLNLAALWAWPREFWFSHLDFSL